jgi:predicted enzyme related to lactoylglutathione lyase
MKKRRSAVPRSVQGMNLTLQNTFLEVDDHEAALAYYRDTLGLEVRNDVAMEFGRWLTVGPVGQPELGIVLQSAGVGRSPEDAKALQSLLAKGSLSGLVFTTGDVDGVFEKVRASGAEVMQEPMDMPYGVRDCAFRDPAGNMVRFSQPKA